MALSQIVPENSTTEKTDEVAAEDTAFQPSDDDLKRDGLYNSASRLEVELEGVLRHNTASLTPGQIGGFNAILKMALQLLSNSVALREDVGEIDETTLPSAAHKALHVTIVPTLHSALPEPLYSNHG